MKYTKKQLAISLRKNGESYGEIAMKIGVSKSTLSFWLRNIELTESQKHNLYTTRQQKGLYQASKQKQFDKIKRISKIFEWAQKNFKFLTEETDFLPGLMLYWAEGDKSKENELVKFSNSDPAMIKFMMHWFRKICQVPNEKFRIGLHIHELHIKEEIEKYWSKITDIPLEQFHKTQIKKTTLGQRKKPLYQGTCSIRISNRTLFRKIEAWKNEFIKVNNLLIIN